MRTPPSGPTIYEINTWPWLEELGGERSTPLTLAEVPDRVWDELAGLGVDAVWLMGVWERSPAGTAIARANADLMGELRSALPDMEEGDLIGSAYCIRRYEVDPRLGGRAGLAAARAALKQRGLGLILDFVPNHVAPDHPWTTEHPGFFVLGDAADLERAPDEFIRVGHSVLARGRDPYFAPWADVVQLNAFDPGLRAAAITTLNDIASQCDGVRCDMAMLVMNDIFAQTWGERAGPPPPDEYWTEVIGAVGRAHPEFLWMAEAYWDKEHALQQLGFDLCYDKRLYDRLVHDGPTEVAGHLQSDPAYQRGLVRFIENHDEPRAAAIFGPLHHRAAAVAALTQTGARLIHEGQLDGRTVRLPVFLGRRPAEPPDLALRAFYGRLLAALRTEPFRAGTWRPCAVTGWPDNGSAAGLVAWAWDAPGAWAVVVVNLSDADAQGRAAVAVGGIAGRSWVLADAFSGEQYERDGDSLADEGLYVSLPAWGAHILIAAR
jgi:hypothetical protein